MQILGDLGSRPAPLEQFEHLRLAWCELQVRMLMRLLDQVRDLSKDPDHVLAAKERHRAHFDANPAAVCADYLDVGVRDLRRADDLSREELASTSCVLG